MLAFKKDNQITFIFLEFKTVRYKIAVLSEAL